MASGARRPVASTPWPRLVIVVRRSSSTTSPSSPRWATSSRVVFVPMSMTATGTSVQQLEHPLHRAREQRAVTADHDRPLHEGGVLRHERYRLVVSHVAASKAELLVDRLARAEQLPRRPPGLRDQLPDLVLGERLHVVVHPVEVDAPLLEQHREVLARRAGALLVHRQVRHLVDATE